MSVDRATVVEFADTGEALLAEVVEQSDSLSAVDAVDMLLVLDDLAAQVNAARAMLQQQAILTIEQPIQRGGRIVSVVDGGHWVRDPQALESQIVTAAAGDPVKAVEITFAMCVPPSKLPTKGGLAKLGLTTRDIATWKGTGRKLDVRDTRAPEGER